MGSSFWMPVNDEASARDAVKMGGLPILLIGFNTLVFCLIGFLQGSLSNTLVIGGVILSLLLVVFSFRIRSGKAGSLPYLSALFLIFFVLSALFSLIGNILQGGAVVGGVMFVVGLIVPVLAMLLSISGLRGWNWLRKNGHQISV